ncbi:MAG: T9SS type A sorting domain-containing protein [Niastella sp.]|uniref:T9SS type A sorting domain-containing protein n=1 Tax=Niastella sp. TaxID=1869183 RepID=UPI00389A6C1D
MYPVPVLHGNKIAMLLFCFVCFNASFVKAQCIDTTANPTVSASVSTGASIYSFNNPSNALANDASRATATSLLQLFGDETTDYLQVKGFGFNIPTAASICGIQATVVRSASNVDLLFHTSSVKDIDVRLMKGGALTGINEAHTSTEWPSSDGNATYGSNSDLWGISWSPADINSNNFGFSISAKIHGTVSLFPAARINYISMTVSYLDPTVLSTQALQFRLANGANHSAALSWKLNTTDEGVTYSVERSVNGMKWQPVQGLPQQNFHAAMFSFIDAQPLPGQSFYRLKITFSSGEVRYSTIQSFEYLDSLSLKGYPNPVTTIIQVAGVIPGERVALTDLYGKRLFLSAPAKNTIIQLDVAHLQPGMYVISAGNRKMKIQKK